MKSMPTLYVFDLDGVITNPDNSSVNTQLLEKIYLLLSEGNRIAVNTGRSYAWVEKNLISYLNEKNSSALFINLIVVCEKGGEMIVWKDNTSEITPSKFALSPDDYRRTKRYFEGSEQLATMFWDSTKRTMASIEKKPTADLDVFHKQQSLLAHDLSLLFEGHDVKVDATTIATDVESPLAGKYAGAEIIYEWASNTDPVEENCVCFGDSISDFDMAKCFADKNLSTTFVYLGKTPEKLEVDNRIKVVIPNLRFDAGAHAYLNLMSK